jgi:hypothetical protein
MAVYIHTYWYMHSYACIEALLFSIHKIRIEKHDFIRTMSVQKQPLGLPLFSIETLSLNRH